MGKVLSVIQRKANRFNVENRAHKVISMEKPKPAPRHPSTEHEIKTIKSVSPQFLEQQYKKDSELDNRLKEVYVQSHDPMIVEEATSDSSRPLPQDRTSVEEPEFGYLEPTMVPEGRFTLKQAIKFITDHHSNPSVWTAAAIAKEYNLNQDKLEKILFYYRTFEVHIPEHLRKQIPKVIGTEADKIGDAQKLLSEKNVQHQEK